MTRDVTRLIGDHAQCIQIFNQRAIYLKLIYVKYILINP